MAVVLTDVQPLAARFSGRLLLPSDEGYDAARRIHNGLVDRRPALIAQCANADDVAAAVSFARERSLPIAVRAGGHGVAGRSTVDAGVMIDLSIMKGIEVDVQAREARVEPGVTWGELNAATQRYGLAVTGGVVSTTGVSGLTLGGGWGWLAAVHGLACDNLLSATMITADGRVLAAGEDERPELFWALRGGGGNFGVVVSFRFQLHAVGPTLYGGVVAHPLERGRELLRLHRELTASAPDALTLSAGLLSAPDGTKLAALLGCWLGELDAGERMFRPVRDLGSPVMGDLGPIDYCAMNALMDPSFPKGALNYWKSRYFGPMEDAAIDMLVERFAECPSAMTGVVLDHWHGAATRASATATAFPHRREGRSLLLLSQWADPSDTDRNIAWTRATHEAMQPYGRAERYVNYLDADDSGESESLEIFGENERRLAEIKARYDPGDVFHGNAIILPSA